MSLPPNYQSAREYLNDVLTFLKTHQWLYNYSNTHVVVNNVFENFPHDWKLYFKKLSTMGQLNTLLLGTFDEDCPASLKKFLFKLTKLKAVYNDETLKCDYKVLHNSGLSRKKVHEILALSPLVDQVCKENDLNLILDIGCGLGYLSHLLHLKYDYSVLGIDCSSQYVAQAYKNQEKHYPKSKSFVKFSEHFINENSGDQLKKLIVENFDLRNCCLTGLHACADLSVTILDLFDKLEFIKALVIMPCCYHRIQIQKEKDDVESFKNFPASKTFKEYFEAFDAEQFLRRPFLRLACQQSQQNYFEMTRDEREIQARNCLYRAVLQAVVEEENCRVARQRRKSGKSSVTRDFQEYLNNLGGSHRLVPRDADGSPPAITSDDFQEKMRAKFDERKDDLNLVEALAGLQAALQDLCENLVLLDRVEFLREKGHECYVRKVTVDSISPRCYAVVANKR